MTMARYSGVVQDDAGNIITNAKVEVRREVSGQPLAALKSDRAGVSAITNPFDAEADGTFFFHVVGGAYKVRVYTGPSGAPTFERILRYMPVGLASETDATIDGEIAPYLGHVATRTRIPYVWDNTATITLSRTRHTAKDNINNPQFVFPNWYVHGIGGSPDWQEKGPGSSATIQA